MEMEDEFYASIKLISGEEIFSLVCVSDEEEDIFLLLDNPIIITPMVSKSNRIIGYKVTPWMMIPDDDLYIISMDRVMTMTEIKNNEIIRVYNKYKNNTSKVPLDKNMGFISKVDDARKLLEKIYNS
jgi:acyl-CoA synthetase (NDP forming)